MGESFTFSDLFKSSFLKDATFFLSFSDILTGLSISVLTGLGIYLIYKYSFRGVLYSKNFGISLVLMPVITCVLIMAVASNLILSLGMVGALSIVRFRTSIKDPLDIVFLFWAISVGIVSGAGLFFLSILGSVLTGLIIFLLSGRVSGDKPFLLTVHCEYEEGEKQVARFLEGKTKRRQLKAKTISSGEIELVIELRLKNPEISFIDGILKIPGVKDAVLISYNGDYVS